MYVSVIWTPDAPMDLHIGISRSFAYLVGMIRGLSLGKPSPAFAPHANLAMSLHSFAARVMLRRDPNILYMITSLVPKMRRLFEQELPGNVVLGSTLGIARKQYFEDFTKGKYPQIDELNRKKASLGDNYLETSSRISTLRQKQHNEPELISEITKLYAELDMIRKNTHQINLDIVKSKANELSRIAESIPITLETSPIARTLSPLGVKIYSKDRCHILFDYNRDSQTAIVYGRRLTGDAAKRFDWFFHPNQDNDSGDPMPLWT